MRTFCIAIWREKHAMRKVLKVTFALFTFAIFSGIPSGFSALESFSIAPANAVPLITTTCTNPLVATDGSYTVVSFKTVESCTWTPPADNLSVEYLIVAGGGGGGAGGGGAGGLLAGTTTLGSVTSTPIIVGGGGAGGGNIMISGENGGNSQAIGLTAIGGGGGGGYSSAGLSGGSGGGNTPESANFNFNTGPVGTAGQGSSGGIGSWGGGGGGGAGSDGTSSTPPTNRDGGNGGIGLSNSITGSATFYAGGGGGMCTGGCANGSQGGLGGGGKGSNSRYGNDDAAGIANTGGGGGGADGGSNGGSGVVIVRFLTSAIVVNDPMLLTAIASPSTSMVMNIPLFGTVSNITIDWGDGSTSGPFNSSGEQSHVYTSPGTYTVTIGGAKLTQFGAYCSNTSALTSVQSFGDLGLTDLSYAFCGASELTQVPTQIPTGVTNLQYAFLYASSFNQNISTWNTSAVTSMVGMFRGASSFNNGSANNDGLNPMASISGGWNTSNVVSFGEMFLGASSFNQDVSSWDTSNATNVSMFNGAPKFNNGSATNDSAHPLRTNGNKWDVSNVTNFAGLFGGASHFNQDISNWDVSSANNLTEMFRGASRFNQDISTWRFPNVTDLNYMFVDATSFNNGGQPLTWDVSRITSMYVTFANATSFNSDISSWNVSKMVYFISTFVNATAFNADISGWNLSSVNNMNNMLQGASSFNQNLGGWTLSTTLVNAQNFLVGTSMTTANYDALLNGWATQATGSGVNFSTDLRYTESGKIGRQTLTGSRGWTISDAGLKAPTAPSISSWPSAGGIVSGQSLSDVLLSGGSASVPGSFAFANLNTVPAVGTDSHQVVFTPTDSINYTTVTSSGNANVTVVVSRATPSVTNWPSAGGIVSGQSLSDVLLSGGSASVPGSFAFANLNTVPAVGTDSHQVVFTPTDSINYTTVTSSGNANVTVVVSEPTPTPTPEPTPTVNASGLEVINPVADAPLQVAETTVTAVTLIAAVSAAAAASTAVSAVAAAAGTAASAGSAATSTSANSAGRSSASSSPSSNTSSSNSSRNTDASRNEDARTDKSIDDELLELKKIRSGDSVVGLDASTKWGDNLPLWSAAALVALDKPSVKITHRSAPKSPFTAKLIAESAYLRAALGSAFIALPIISVLAALIGLQQIDGLFLPPEVTAMSVILIIGVLDGFAGLIGMLTFGIGLIINPGITTPSDLRMLLGLSLLGFAPGMLASAFRNLRRPEAITSHQIYERAVDLIVAPFLAGWATLGIVSALPALAGAELPIQESANVLAWCAAITMFVRVLLEELAVKYFPKRSKELNPANLNTPSMKQKVISLILRMGLFFFVSMAFVGHCWQLYVGTIIFIIPSFVGLYRDKFPNYPKLYQILPSGLPGLGFALLLASASLVILQSLFGETPEFAKIAFVLLPIPGLVLSLLGILGRAPHDGDVRWYMRPKNLWVYRLGGVLVLLGTLRLTNII